MENELNNFLNTNELSAAQVKNICEVELIELNKITAIEKEVKKEGTKDEYTQVVCMYEGEKYRIPKGILIDIKKLSDEYVLESIKVMKSGSGMDTKYTLVPVKVEAKVSQ